MTPSDNSYNIIKQFESFRPTAYRPTRRDVWTIGWGHTLGVKEGDTCTQDQAQHWLKDDVSVAARAVEQFVKVPLTQNQYDALVSFVYNLGSGNFKESRLLILLNEGMYAAVAADMLNYDRQGGVVLAGLDRRRAAERALFVRS